MWITIDGGDFPGDVEVSGAGGASSDELAAAIRAECGIAESTPLIIERTGAPLSGDGAADLRDGDVVRTGPGRPQAPRSPALADLVVAGGPAMGQRIPLPRGVFTVGRSERCDLTIDDESLSSLHLRVHANEMLQVEDVESTNGTFIDARRLVARTPQTVAFGTTIELGRTLLRIDTPARGDTGGVAEDGKVPFNRPPRVGGGVRRAPVTLAPPPAKPDRPRVPLGASILPVIVGVVLWQVTGSVTMLAFTALSPALAFWTFTEQRHGSKRRYKREREAFVAQIASSSAELAAGVDLEARERRAASPDAAELLRRVQVRDPQLWERSPDDQDFLALRVGVADQPAETVVTVSPGGDDELQQLAEQSLSPHRMAPAVPLVVSLRDHPVIGLCGAGDRAEGLARWLIGQAACLQSPRELAIAAAIDVSGRDSWSWVGWLPHNRAPSGLQDEGLLAIGHDASRALLERLIELIAERGERNASRVAGPALLVLLDERCRLDRGFVSQVLDGARDAGLSVIWLGSDRHALPGECDAIVELAIDKSRLDLTLVDEGRRDEASADGLPLEIAREIARALAPIRDTSARRAGSELPTQVMLLDLAGIEPVTAASVAERWSRSGRARGAPIGATADGVFAFDPRVDGPHALIAGTTGSGKSELLQTLVCSLAVTYPPNRMSFLLIDYKGGAAFRECRELPHVVGLVTDLDGHLSQRALTAMNAELLRRERDMGGHKDLASMERVAPDAAPARLMIVVDEFATLVKEVPEFIDGVINVALRGRSLGIHLVLATQRPSGVISPQIRANTDLRIALRTSDAVESNDVIDSPLAGRIAREQAGRAYARSGQRLVELQTAYVGAHRSRGERKRVVVRRLSPGDLSQDGGNGLDESSSASGPSDLHLIVGAVDEATRAGGLAPPPSPWLPPLASHLSLEDLAARVSVADPASSPLIGLLDQPAQQRQEPFSLDLEADGHVLLYGTSGSGKTTFLRTLAAALASGDRPGEVQIYGLDCATRGLGAIERIPQVGSVVASDDVVRARRLIERVSRVIDQRKREFALVSASSLVEYRRISGKQTPRMVVLIDDYAGYVTAFERVDGGWMLGALPRLLGEGRPLGVHFVITAAVRNAVPQSLMGLIPRRIVMRLASESDYDMVGLGRRTVGDAVLPPGRGFLMDGRELQCAVIGADASGDGQARALERLGDAIRSRSGERGTAPPITVLAGEIARAQLPRAAAPLDAVVGLDEEGDTAAISLARSHFIVAGPYQSGRSTSLATIVQSLAESTPGCELHLLAPRRSLLSELALWTSVAASREDSDVAVKRIAERLAAGVLNPASPTVLVVDGAEDIGDANMPHPLDALARAGRDAGLRIVVALERQTAGRVFSGWIAEIKKDEHGLLLDPDVDVDGQIVGARLPRRTSVTFVPGRGYLVRGGEALLVQIAR